MMDKKEYPIEKGDMEPAVKLLETKNFIPDFFIDKFINSIIFLENNNINTTNLIKHLLKSAKKKDIDHVFHDFSMAKFLHLYLRVNPTSTTEINQTKVGPDLKINNLKCDIKWKRGIYNKVIKQCKVENRYNIRQKFRKLFDDTLLSITGIRSNGKIEKSKSPLISGIKQNSDVVIVDVSSTEFGLGIGGRPFDSKLPEIIEKQTLYIFLQDVVNSDKYYGTHIRVDDVLWNKLRGISKKTGCKF